MAIFVASAGAACNMSDVAHQDGPALTGDIEDYINPRVLWLRASGPKGERDPNALPLYEAIFAHDAARVAVLLDQERSPDLPLYAGRASPLAIAIALNDLEVVKVLVKHGANINCIFGDDILNTPLASALDYGRFYNVDNPNFDIFHYLLKAGVDVNKEYGDSNIGFDTAMSGHMHLLNEILDRGFNRDLPGLKRIVDNRLIHGNDLKEKNRAISKINKFLNTAAK